MIHLDKDYLFRRYVEDLASVADISAETGIPRNRLMRALKKNGVAPRSARESLALKESRRRAFLLGQVAERFRAGENVKEIATALAVTRRIVWKCLDDLAIDRRTRSEVMLRWSANITAEVRRQRNDAARQANRKQSAELVQARLQVTAKKKQFDESHIGIGEAELTTWMRERKLSVSQQVAFGVYNVDLLLSGMAVEVHNRSSVPHSKDQHKARIEFLLECGLNVLYVKIRKSRTMFDEGVAVSALNFLDESCEFTEERKQYRLVDGSGNLMAAGSLQSGALHLLT